MMLLTEKDKSVKGQLPIITEITRKIELSNDDWFLSGDQQIQDIYTLNF